MIVFSPWSIETSKFPWYTKGDETKRGQSQWDYIVGEMTSNKTNQVTLERIANQRRRHANVMLSRPILSLVIINLDHNLTSGQNGGIDLGLIQTQLPNLNDPSIEYGTNLPSGLGEKVTIKGLDKESMNEQLEWLSSLINAKKALRQIVSSSCFLFWLDLSRRGLLLSTRSRQPGDRYIDARYEFIAFW